jgi:hypothetical protein
LGESKYNRSVKMGLIKKVLDRERTKKIKREARELRRLKAEGDKLQPAKLRAELKLEQQKRIKKAHETIAKSKGISKPSIKEKYGKRKRGYGKRKRGDPMGMGRL